MPGNQREGRGMSKTIGSLGAFSIYALVLRSSLSVGYYTGADYNNKE